MGTDLIAVKDIAEFICSQFSIRANVRTSPSHSHLPRGHCLKLKVPLSLGDSVRLLCPEDSNFVTADVLEAVTACRETEERRVEKDEGRCWRSFKLNEDDID